ncbi:MULTISPECIES: hypothetical protein [unclassified Nonomuraea]|uniref:hypothetical protein n=1 Tax=unclassified Nonomuraea TaxID=2593643 RepID=UPI0033CDC7CE
MSFAAVRPAGTQEEGVHKSPEEGGEGSFDLSEASLRDIAALSDDDPSVFAEAVKRAIAQSGFLPGFNQSI